MKQPQITDFINGPVTYDENGGGYFWVNSYNGIQMLGEIRGWGHIQHKFQDDLGKFIAEAINEKVEKLKTV